MAILRKHKRLLDAYRFTGFRPQELVRGVFGDSKARIITLVRRSKKQSARSVVERRWALGFVEGLNNKIRVIQRRAYGLHDAEYLRLKVLTCMLPKI